MTDDEGLSVREAADWYGAAITTREVTPLRRQTPARPTVDS
jgi:hypothetical protein